jgi:hypothetical protein
MMRLGSLNFAKPFCEGRQHPPTHGRDAVDQLRKLTGAEHKEPHLALGGDRCGARGPVKKSHLAEAVAGAKLGASLALDCHLRPTIGDHESLLSNVALAHQDSASGDLDLLSEGCNTGEVSLAAGREELDLREPFDLGIARPSRSPHRHEYLSGRQAPQRDRSQQPAGERSGAFSGRPRDTTPSALAGSLMGLHLQNLRSLTRSPSPYSVTERRSWPIFSFPSRNGRISLRAEPSRRSPEGRGGCSLGG